MNLICLIRSSVAAVLVVIITVLMAIFTVVLNYFFSLEKLNNATCYLWARTLLFLFNIQLETKSIDQIPKGGAIYIFNHTSLFDIPVLFCAFKGKSIRFGAKDELFNIPFFGASMVSLGMLRISRANPSKVIKLYQESVPKVHEGTCFCLAPEGGRQSGKKIEKFRTGPFVFAKTGGIVIQPVILRGVNKVMLKKDYLPVLSSWKTKVQLEALPQYKRHIEHPDVKSIEMKDECHLIMTKAYEAN